MPRKKIDMWALKSEFNDKVMREMGLDMTDEGYVYDMDSTTIIQIKEKFIKYCEDEYEANNLRHNEIELNLIENPRLMETLTLMYLHRRINNKIEAMTQATLPGSQKGYFVLSFLRGNQVAEMRSGVYANESVRIFNLICKINKTSHMYDFTKYDIPIERK